MKQIKQLYTIDAPVKKVWQALTDATMIAQWGAGPAKMDATEGGEFSLWDGDIHGINTKVIPGELLKQDWYGHDHPDRCYKVAYILQANGDVTILELRQADVPDHEAEEMADGWREYYFEPIIKLLEDTEPHAS